MKTNEANTAPRKYYVTCIYSDEYGFLGVAKNYQTAVKFLYKEGWITDDVTLYDDNGQITTLLDYMGNDWLNKQTKWTIDEFNDFWSSCYSLIKCEVYMG